MHALVFVYVDRASSSRPLNQLHHPRTTLETELSSIRNLHGFLDFSITVRVLLSLQVVAVLKYSITYGNVYMGTVFFTSTA